MLNMMTNQDMHRGAERLESRLTLAKYPLAMVHDKWPKTSLATQWDDAYESYKQFQ
jgi:hypothetical protein